MAGGPIRSHSTDTFTKAWTDPRMETKLGDGPTKVLRQAYAWVDPDGNPDSKGSDKFTHHEVGPRREVGAANLKACTSGIGILNGARRKANIPRAHRRAATTTWPDIFVTERSRQVSSEVRLFRDFCWQPFETSGRAGSWRRS